MEFLYKIAQESQNGSIIHVYHRTRAENTAESICTVGFIAGGGAMYGKGIYSTRDLQSSLRNSNLGAYGAILIEASVNVNGFLILDYDLAKQVYGQNYRLIDQIEKVIGWDLVSDIPKTQGTIRSTREEFVNISESLERMEFSSDVACRISRAMGLDSTGINGIVYTGRTDGKCVVTYNPILVTPLRHAWVDGKTYKNPKWKDCPAPNQEALEELKMDEVKHRAYIKERKELMTTLSQQTHEKVIDVHPDNYPHVPAEVFKGAIANVLYQDDSYIDKLSPELKESMGQIIRFELLVKKMSSEPTLYWDEYESMDEETREAIPTELLADIWQKYLDGNTGRWADIPDIIKPLVNKDKEIQYWLSNTRSNKNNWGYVPKDLVEVISEENPRRVPDKLINELNKATGSWEELGFEQINEDEYQTRDFTVGATQVDWIKTEIGKLNRRSARMSFPLMHVKVIKEDRVANTKVVRVMGKIPVFEGWKIVGKMHPLQDEQGKNINALIPLGNELVPQEYVEADPICDHCNINRQRSTIYIIHNTETGEYRTVGSSCLDKFFPNVTNPEQILKQAEKFNDLLTMFSETDPFAMDDPNKVRKKFKQKGVPLPLFLGKVIRLMRSGNFVTGRQSSEQGLMSTGRLAHHMCLDEQVDKTNGGDSDLTSDEINQIDEAIKWALSLDNLPPDQNQAFLSQINAIAKAGIVITKVVNFAAGILPGYRRGLPRLEVDYERLLGEIGDTIHFKGTLTTKKPIFFNIKQSGGANKVTQTYCVARDGENRIALWSSEDIKANEGDEIHIQGKIVNHTRYNRESATSLTNVQETDSDTYALNEEEEQKKLQAFIEKNKGDSVEDKLVPEGNPPDYSQGKPVESDYLVDYVRVGPGQKWYLFKMHDAWGTDVSAFLNDAVHVKSGDIIRVKGTVTIHRQYGIQLNKAVLVDKNKAEDKTTQPTPKKPVPKGKYNIGDILDTDLTVVFVANDPTQYGGIYHVFMAADGQRFFCYPKNYFNMGDKTHVQGKLFKEKQYKGETQFQIKAPKFSPPVGDGQPPQPQLPKQPQRPPLPAPIAPTVDDGDGDGDDGDNDGPQGSSALNITKVASWIDIGEANSTHRIYKLAQTDIPEEEEDAPESQAMTLQQIGPDKAYKQFSESYQNATGNAWDRGKFMSKASDWLFYGGENGYIAVRPQRSGMLKMCGVAGDDSNPVAKLKDVLRGFEALMSEGKPVWGMVSDEIQKLALRKGMISPPGLVVKMLIKAIPSYVFGGAEVTNVGWHGDVTFQYRDIGETTKYLIGNREYYQKIKNDVTSGTLNIPKGLGFVANKLIGWLSGI